MNDILFSNHNQSVTKMLSKRYFKTSKRRNTITIIAIILTSMLFTMVITLGVGALHSVRLAMVEMGGQVPAQSLASLAENWPSVIAVTFFILLFVITGYLLIYNIFEISVAQNIKKYGLLRAIGTTGRQIRMIVRKQALWLSCIAIPVGLTAGYIIGKYALPLVLSFMNNEYKNISANVKPMPVIFIVSGLFSAFTVWISIKKPSSIAAAISPIEAIRYSEKNEKYRSWKFFSKHRLLQMANANLWRNSKRSVFIIISVLFCILLVNSSFTVGNSVDIDKYIASVISSDFVVASPETFSNVLGFQYRENALPENIITELNENIPVQNAGSVYKNTLDDTNVTYDYGNKIVEIDENIPINGHMMRFGIVENQPYPITLGADNRALCNVYGASDSIIPKLNIIDSGLDTDTLLSRLKSKKYVIEVVVSNVSEEEAFKLPLNQEITIYKNGQPYNTVSVLAHATITSSLAEAPGRNNGYLTVGGDCPLLYMSSELFLDLYDTPALLNYCFDVDKAEFPAAAKYLDSKQDVQYASTETLKESMNGLKQMIFIIGGLVSFLIAFISIVNFTNIIITGMIDRQREFAALESIGMTKKQIYRLVVYEGLFYAFFVILTGIPTSYAIAVGIIPAFFSQPDFWLFTVRPTVFPAVIVALMVCILAAAIPPIAFHYFNRKSVIERLKITE